MRGPLPRRGTLLGLWAIQFEVGGDEISAVPPLAPIFNSFRHLFQILHVTGSRFGSPPLLRMRALSLAAVRCSGSGQSDSS